MAKEKKEGSTVSVGSDTVRMRFPNERQTRETRAISVEGTTYEREADGSFIVSREHVQAMRNQGLDLDL